MTTTHTLVYVRIYFDGAIVHMAVASLGPSVSRRLADFVRLVTSVVVVGTIVVIVVVAVLTLNRYSYPITPSVCPDSSS